MLRVYVAFKSRAHAVGSALRTALRHLVARTTWYLISQAVCVPARCSGMLATSCPGCHLGEKQMEHVPAQRRR